MGTTHACLTDGSFRAPSFLAALLSASAIEP